jgi:hypothetical protein
MRGSVLVRRLGWYGATDFVQDAPSECGGRNTPLASVLRVTNHAAGSVAA